MERVFKGVLGYLIKYGRAAAAMGAVLGAGGADAACRPVAREGFVVDDKRGE